MSSNPTPQSNFSNSNPTASVSLKRVVKEITEGINSSTRMRFMLNAQEIKLKYPKLQSSYLKLGANQTHGPGGDGFLEEYSTVLTAQIPLFFLKHSDSACSPVHPIVGKVFLTDFVCNWGNEEHKQANGADIVNIFGRWSGVLTYTNDDESTTTLEVKQQPVEIKGITSDGFYQEYLNASVLKGDVSNHESPVQVGGTEVSELSVKGNAVQKIN